MELESLLLSRDPEVLRVLRLVLEKLNITFEICTSPEAASELLSLKKFDAIVIDCDDLLGGTEVLQQVRKGQSNRSTVTFAVLNGTTTVRSVFEKGASFVLQKPLTVPNSLRALTASYGFMYRERRRYFRVPVDIPAVLSLGKDQQVKVTVCNLSEGGMAIRTPVALSKRISEAQFVLPGTNQSFSPKADLAWIDGGGHAGIRFLELPQSTRERLEAWILDKLQRTDVGQPKRVAPIVNLAKQDPVGQVPRRRA